MRTEPRNETAKRPTKRKRVGARGKRNGKPAKPAADDVMALNLEEFVPEEIGDIGDDHQTAIPKLARDPEKVGVIEAAVQRVPTRHQIGIGDARILDFIPDRSVHLVVTSPPYWTLKEYNDGEGQMGHIADYEEFLKELDRVWAHCYRALVPGGRLIIVVGDVCLSRRKNKGRHMVVPLHASIQEHCRHLGFDNVQGIIWQKIANAAYEVEGAGGFLGKPYEPNAVIKNDVEYILMQRKHGGYRSPSIAERVLSVIGSDRYQEWFRVVWEGVTGASTKEHPAPYPVGLAERLIRMYSFVGDTVLDPFMGTGTTSIAAAKWGRNSIGVELDPTYFEMARKRLETEVDSLFSNAILDIRG
jgi:DNA modification methylase